MALDFLSKYLLMQFYSVSQVPNTALATLAVDFPGWEGVQDEAVGAELAKSAAAGEQAFNAMVELAYPGRVNNGRVVSLPEYDGEAVSPSAPGTTLTSDQAKRFLDAGIHGNISTLSRKYIVGAQTYWSGVKARNPGLDPAAVNAIDMHVADTLSHFDAAVQIATSRL